jgi:O-antigen/teichoic acid export membrane protein
MDARRSARAATRLRPVGRDLVLSATGQVIYLLAQLGVLSALAHYRGPFAVGQLGLALALATPIFLWANSGFRSAQAADVEADFSFAEYGGVRLAMTCVAVVLLLGLGTMIADDRSTFAVILVIALTKCVESISTLGYGAFQRVERIDLVAASFIMRGCGSLPLLILFLELGASTALALTAQLIVWSVVAVFFDYPRASRITTGKIVAPTLSWLQGWKLTRFTAPLSFGLLGNSLQMSIPRLFLERYLGLEALGIFTAVGYFQQAGVTASNSISHALIGRFARLSREKEYRQIYSLVFKLAMLFSALGLLVAAVCYLWGNVVLRLIFGLAFADAGHLLFLVSLAVAIRVVAVLPQTLLLAERRYKLFLSFQAASVILTIVLCIFIIPRYGIVGACYILLGTATFRLIFMEAVTLIRRRNLQNGGGA